MINGVSIMEVQSIKTLTEMMTKVDSLFIFLGKRGIS